MKKTVIIFASTHHGSTRTLAEALARKYDADLIDATLQHRADLSGYEYIGFASGIASESSMRQWNNFWKKICRRTNRYFSCIPARKQVTVLQIPSNRLPGRKGPSSWENTAAGAITLTDPGNWWVA